MADNPYTSLIGEAPAAVGGGSDNPYADIMAQDRQRKLAASALEAEPHQPDHVAEAVRLGAAAGVPTPTALDNLDTLRGEQRQRDMDRLAKESPILARWLEAPENLAVAKDDVEGLSFFDQSVRNFKDAMLPEGALKAGANIGRHAGAGFRFGMPQAAFGLAAAGAESLDLLDTNAAMARAYGMKDVVGPVGAAGGRLREESTAIRRDAEAFKGDQTGVGFVERSVASGAESLGTQALPTLVSFLTGNPAPMLAMMGLQTSGAAYPQAREEGVDPLTSLVFAGGQGIVEVGTELLPALNLFKNLKMGSPIWKTILEQQVREQPGEQIATALQDFNEFVTLPSNHDKTVGDYLLARPEAAAQTAIATLFASSVQTGTLASIEKVSDHLSTSAMKAEQGQRAAERAKAALGYFTGLDAAADALKLQKRSPEKMEEAAQTMLAAQGRETVFMPVAEFETFYQSQGTTPESAWQHLTGSSDYAVARATGADLQIPYAKYLARLTPDERKALTPHLRLSPEAMTAVEAEAFGKDDKLAEEASEAAPGEGNEAYDFIYNDLLGQLMTRFPRDVADKYAAKEAARFVTFNRDRGVDPIADYQAQGPQIVSEIPAALQRTKFDVALDPMLERLRAGNVPTEREVRGKTLLEFLREKGGIQDEGGDLASMDADKADRAIRTKGQRRLVNPEGMTLDAAREAAVEAGYLTEAEADAESTSDLSQLLSAIDSELRGSPVYAQSADDSEGDTRRQLTALGDFLAQSGVDLNTTSNEEVKKFLQSGATTPKMQAQDQTVLAQGKPIQTDTPEFKAWFGDSKAVDSDGTPLLMYHQTSQDAASKILAGGFSTAAEVARARLSDEQVPNGIFFKPHDRDIGVGTADKDQIAQIPVYLSLQNPMIVDNRNTLAWHMRTLNKEYAAAEEAHKQIDKKYAPQFDALFGKNETPEEDAAIQAVLDEWDAAGKESATKMRAMVDATLKAEGHDGVVILNDDGSMGRKTRTFIALRSEQVKHAVANRGTFDPNDANILHQSAAPAWPELAEAVQQRDAGTLDDKALADRVDALIDDGRAPQYLTEHSEDADFLTAAREAAALTKRGGDGGNRINATEVLNSILGVEAVETMFQSAYHGSPHDFDKFSTGKIGTGEGAQAYGWGLYFAENPQVADGYRKALSGRVSIGAPRASDPAYIAAARNFIDNGITGDEAVRGLSKAYPKASEADLRLALHEANPGRIYQVDIPDEATARMLDWDRPLSEQPESVRKALKPWLDRWLKNADIEDVANRTTQDWVRQINEGTLTGEQIYRGIGRAASDGDKRASKALAAAGIPGIRYLDQGSRVTPAEINAAKRTIASWQARAERGEEMAKGQLEIAEKALSDLQRKAQEGTRNLVVFDDKIITLTHKDGTPVTAAERKEYFQAAADGSAPRAQIQFTKRGGGPRQFFITLKGSTDLTSFVHEMGHYWLERMIDVALTPDAPQRIKDDVAVLLDKYGGVTVEQWDGLDEKKRTEIHESIARANELYLFEGKAPSAKLRAVFARIRNWMLQVYERMTALNVELSPEVRAVFDRMYASQQEIAQARSAQSMQRMYGSQAESGMNDPEWAAYTGMADAAKAQAEEELAAEVLEPIRREDQAWWKSKREAVTQEVTEQVNRRKDIVAASVLRTGELPDGTGTALDKPKLSKDALVKDFGLTAESLAKLHGFYSASGGLSADELAPTFGYATGKQLLEALAVVPNKAALIKESVDAELKRRYPDIIDDGSIGDRAMRAVHNDKAGELLVREAQILAEQAGKAATGKTAGLRAYQLSRQMAKAAAQQVIERTALKDIQPARWKAAEAKAGNEAYRLAREGKLDQAAAAKRKQVLNHFLYKEALVALETADERVEHLRSLSTKGKREAIGKAGGNEYVVTYRDGTQETVDSRKAAEEAAAAKGGFWFATNTYLEQIDRVLERYELRVQTNRKLASRESLRSFVDKLNADGIPHAIPDEVIADAREVNYRELPYGFLLGVSDAVRSIEHVALRKSELIIAGQKRDRDEAAQAIAGGIKGNIKDRLPSIGDPSLPEKALDYGNDALSLYLNADYMAREMDGGEAGVVTDLVYRPLAEAEVHALNRRAQAEKDMAALFTDHYTPAELRRLYKSSGADAVPMPEIGEVWSKSNVLALALNWGNEGNRQAILGGQYAGGRRLTQASVDRLLGTLTENDWKFVQATWKYIDSYWGEIKAKQQQRTGIAPEKVAGLLIQTKFGQIEGGYYPLKFDARQGGRAAVDDKADLFQDLLTGRNSAAQTKRGHTVERVGSGGKPVKIDLSVAVGHVAAVINDLELGDAVSAVYRLLEHRKVRQAFTDAGKSAYHSQLKLWVKDVARGQTAAHDAASVIGRFLRTNFVKSVLTFKVATAILQQTGHIASLKVIGPKAWGKGMTQMLTRPWAGKNSLVAQIGELSPFMKSRWDSATANAGVYDVMRNAKGDSRPSWFVRSGYWAMLHSQMLVDAPTWMGAYLKAKGADPSNHKAAVRAADDAVKHAQGSGLFADRSALERGTLSEDTRQAEWVKTWTTLLSYMMAKGRLAYETTGNTSFKNPLQVAQWTLSMVMLFAVESMIANVIRGGGPDDGDDDELDVGDIAKWAGKQAGLTALGTVPLLSLLGNELQGFRGGISITDAMHRIGSLEQQREQGEWDKAAARATSDVVGLLTGFPSGQANIAIDAFWRDQDGEDVSPIEYLMRTSKD